MAARTVVGTVSSTAIAISASLPATYDAAGYAATTITYTTIGEVENFGNHGVTAAVTEFTPIATAVVAKMKGSKNYGNMSLVVGDIATNAGQVILKAASESNNHYSVKLTYPDNEIHYLDVIVAKHEFQGGAVNDAMKVACDLAICRAPIIVAAV
jgi:hypothetical protein